jgi:glycolate oxidase FAD binding subunit
VRAQASSAGGTAMLFRGVTLGNGPRFHPLPAVSLGLHRRLKERFDPQAVFNRGRLIAGL